MRKSPIVSKGIDQIRRQLLYDAESSEIDRFLRWSRRREKGGCGEPLPLRRSSRPSRGRSTRSRARPSKSISLARPVVTLLESLMSLGGSNPASQERVSAVPWPVTLYGRPSIRFPPPATVQVRRSSPRNQVSLVERSGSRSCGIGRSCVDAMAQPRSGLFEQPCPDSRGHRESRPASGGPGPGGSSSAVHHRVGLRIRRGVDRDLRRERLWTRAAGLSGRASTPVWTGAPAARAGLRPSPDSRVLRRRSAPACSGQHRWGRAAARRGPPPSPGEVRPRVGDTTPRRPDRRSRGTTRRWSGTFEPPIHRFAPAAHPSRFAGRGLVG